MLKYNEFHRGFPSPLASAPAAELFFLHALTNSQLITLGGGRDSWPPARKQCLILGSPLTSQPCLQPMWLLAAPCQHHLICLCEPGMTHMGTRQSTVRHWSVLGTWHHDPQDVLSTLSRDPQPKMNVSIDNDADLLPPPAPSSEGAGVGGWRRAGSQHCPAQSSQGDAVAAGGIRVGIPGPGDAEQPLELELMPWWSRSLSMCCWSRSSQCAPCCPCVPSMQTWPCHLQLPQTAARQHHGRERSPAAGRGTQKQIRAELLNPYHSFLHPRTFAGESC